MKKTKLLSSTRFHFVVIISIMALNCFSGCATTEKGKNSSQLEQDLEKKAGWIDKDTYLSFGYAKADEKASRKAQETLEESCKRKAAFSGKGKIIPAFMSSPNAKPGPVIQKKMASLIYIIESGSVENFEYNPESGTCQCLIRIKKENLRSMVEDVK